VGECTGKIAILLDDCDLTIAHIAAPGEVVDDARDLLDNRGLDALRRLVEDDRAGLGDEHASDGNLLLLAAG
jgi:hypothetical protein